MTILVTGGTGVLGRVVVQRARAGAEAVRVLTRRTTSAFSDTGVTTVTGDLTTGDGVAEAVGDATAIVHCASDVRHARNDIAGTRHLIEAARAAGSPHLVFVSIVGVDRVPLGYYRVKVEVEQLIAESGLPFTILRATQFHEFVLQLLALAARMPVMALPAGTSFQPVDVGDVADRLLTLAASPATGAIDELGGPQTRRVTDLARLYLRARGAHRLLLPLWIPGAVGRGYREGSHLAPDHADGRVTFEEFLAAHPPGR